MFHMQRRKAEVSKAKGDRWETPVIAICSNRQCKAVLISTNLIDAQQGDVTFVNCAIGPCLQCGSSAAILNGNYTAVSTTLFSARQIDGLIQSLRRIQGRTPKKAKAEIVGNSAFGGVARFLPKDAKDLSAYIALLVGALTYMRGCLEDAEFPETLHVQESVARAIESLARTLAAPPSP